MGWNLWSYWGRKCNWFVARDQERKMKPFLITLILIPSLIIGANVASIIFFAALQNSNVELPTPN
jgi:hypothetical protein